MLIERLRRPLQTSTNWSTPTPAVRRVTGWRWQRVAWLPIKGASVSINPITAPTVYITRGISRIYWWAFPVLLSAHTHSNNIRVRSFDTQQQTMVAWWIYGSLALFNRSVTWTWRYCWRLKWSLTRTLKFPPIFMVSFSALYFCLDKFKTFKKNNDNNAIVFLCRPLMPWIYTLNGNAADLLPWFWMGLSFWLWRSDAWQATKEKKTTNSLAKVCINMDFT